MQPGTESSHCHFPNPFRCLHSRLASSSCRSNGFSASLRRSFPNLTKSSSVMRRNLALRRAWLVRGKTNVAPQTPGRNGCVLHFNELVEKVPDSTEKGFQRQHGAFFAEYNPTANVHNRNASSLPSSCRHVHCQPLRYSDTEDFTRYVSASQPSSHRSESAVEKSLFI